MNLALNITFAHNKVVNDSIKIEIELQKAFEKRYQPDSFYQASQNAYQQSLKLNNIELQFKSKLQIALSNLYQNKLEDCEKAFQKLAKELKDINNEKIVIDYYLHYAWFISFKGMVDESITLFHENIIRSQNNGNYKLNTIYDLLSGVEFNAGYYEISLQNKQKARELTDPSDKKTLMEIDSKTGMLYLDIGITDKAIHYYQSSLKLSEEINEEYVDPYYGLGMCYFSKKDFKKAYYNFNKAVSIAKSMNLLTNYYVPINSYLHYWKCSTILNIGNHYSISRDFIEKTKHLLGNDRNPSTAIMHAEIYIYYNQPAEAEKIILDNLSSIEKLDASSLTLDYYYWLALATEKQKKYKDALQYYQRYQALDDSLKNTKILSKIALLQEQFEAAEKIAEINKLNNQVETEKLNSKIAKSRFRNSIITALSIFIIVMAISLYIRNRQKFKMLQIQTNAQQKEHELQKIIEQSKTNILQSNLKGQEKERSRLAKELHDDLGSQLSALRYFVSSKNGVFKNEDEGILKNELKQVHQYIRNISHQLAKPQFADLTLPDIIKEQKHWFHNRNIDIEYNFDKEINWYKVPEEHQNQMYRIIQEAINNSLKHSKANTVLIQIALQHRTIIIEVIDNGIGISQDNRNGLGLKNMQERAQAIGGNLVVAQQHQPKGTKLALMYEMAS